MFELDAEKRVIISMALQLSRHEWETEIVDSANRWRELGEPHGGMEFREYCQSKIQLINEIDTLLGFEVK